MQYVRNMQDRKAAHAVSSILHGANLEMRGETIMQLYLKLLMNYYVRSVYIEHFLLIFLKNAYIYLGKI